MSASDPTHRRTPLRRTPLAAGGRWVAGVLFACALPVAHAQRTVGELEAALASGIAVPRAADAGVAAVAEGCAIGAGDELVLRLGPNCPPRAVARVVKRSIEIHGAVRARGQGCGPLDQCRRDRGFERLQRYASFAYEREKSGGPRYYGQRP